MKSFVAIAMAIAAAAASAVTFAGVVLAGEGERCNFINKRTGNIQRLGCLLDPESFVGPYYLPLNISRRNITEDQIGIPVQLELVIMSSVSCEPIANATVDIWTANATGSYSGITSEGTAGLTFLRGIQVTNNNGEVTFDTIFPGWYQPRAVHIHMEVFLGGQLKHIGRLYFPNIYVDATRYVYPYYLNNDTLYWNEDDSNYWDEGGMYTTIDNPEGSTDAGFRALAYIGINPYGTPNTINPIPRGKRPAAAVQPQLHKQ